MTPVDSVINSPVINAAARIDIDDHTEMPKNFPDACCVWD